MNKPFYRIRTYEDREQLFEADITDRDLALKTVKSLKKHYKIQMRVVYEREVQITEEELKCLNG